MDKQINPLPEIPIERENYEQPVAPEDNQEIREREASREQAEQPEISPEEIFISPSGGATVPVDEIDEKEVARHAEELKVHERPRQVEMLAGLALEKGVPRAVAIAKKLDSYSLDALHDALVDDLYVELKKRGLVKEL